MSDVQTPSQAPSPAKAATPAVDPDREFPVTFRHFHDHHLHKTHDHVWAALLKSRHGRTAKTVKEWRAALDALRNEPAYRPGV